MKSPVPALVPPKAWLAHARTDGALIAATATFDGRRLRAGLVVPVTAGRAGAPEARMPEGVDESRVWRLDGLLSPGFFDLQVNGGGGVLFNGSTTADGVRAIARAHRSTGTAAILPTLITDAPERMEAAADAVLAAFGSDGIAGIHLEGPHISLARRGTHAAAHVRPLDGRTFACLERLRAAGVPTMVTLAPEAVEPGQIARLVEMGVVVALGHTDATAGQVEAALAEGAQTFTHLYNAMSQMQGRAPGAVGAAIASDAYCSLIADGIHVSPAMLALAIRARPRADRMILVSDAMPTVAGPDSYMLYDQRITLRDGRLVNAEGALAGAHVTMIRSVACVAQALGFGPEAALRMAVTNPARLMGCGELARLKGRKVEDLVAISPDLGAARLLAGT